jgi:hypothetical protein
MSISAAECRAASTNQSRKRAMAAPLPESVAWLAHVSMDMSALSADFGSNFGRTATYQLTVVYRPDKELEGVRWTLERSWEDFRAFQRRLLKKMRLGHACGAECGWLYKVVKHYFPKASLLCNNCPKVVETRRQTLLKYMATVQASLLNRGNHNCAVLIGDVAPEVNRFLHSGMKDAELSVTDSSSSELSGDPRSSLFEEEEEDDELDDSSDEEQDARGEEYCDVCHLAHVGGTGAH